MNRQCAGTHQVPAPWPYLRWSVYLLHWLACPRGHLQLHPRRCCAGNSASNKGWPDAYDTMSLRVSERSLADNTACHTPPGPVFSPVSICLLMASAPRVAPRLGHELPTQTTALPLATARTTLHRPTAFRADKAPTAVCAVYICCLSTKRPTAQYAQEAMLSPTPARLNTTGQISRALRTLTSQPTLVGLQLPVAR